jgi:ATP-dependent Clp protease ATP-binding subunit ClpE
MNQVMAKMDGQTPENLFQSLLSGNFDLSRFSDSTEEETEEERSEENQELLPAPIGQDSSEMGDVQTPSRESDSQPSGRPEKKRKFLDQFGTNLTSKALEGKIDRIIAAKRNWPA